MKSLLQINPNASQDALRLNPHLRERPDSRPDPKDEVQGNVERRQGHSALRVKDGKLEKFDPHPRRGRMNKTEKEFAMILEAQKREGTILRYEFEGITLRWPWDGISTITYTADFAVWDLRVRVGNVEVYPIRLIEIKGSFTGGKFERAVERYRHARTYFHELTFEMWRKSKDFGWRREL